MTKHINKTQLTLAISAALAGLTMAQPVWSACTVDGNTFTVNTTTDVSAADAFTTFREAVVAANAYPDCDTINFDAALNGQTITLTEDVNINVTNNVNIVGPGSTQLTITNAGANSRALNMNSGDIDISGITFDGAGTTKSTVMAYDINLAADDIVVKNTGGMRLGNMTSATITNSTFSGNSKTGLSFQDSNNVITVDNCVVSDNTSTFSTGGIRIRNSGFMGVMNAVISNTTIDNNTANTNAGGIYLHASSGDTITITNTTISNNSTTGALSESNISGASGGGIKTANTGNDYNLNIIQSTLSGNTVNAAGGAIYIGSRDMGANINIKHSTITNNTAFYGGGIFNNNSGADINLSNTILAGNTAGSADLTDEDVGTAWVQGPAGNINADYSFIGVNFTNVTDAGTGSILNGGDPELAALADAGNGTQVHALTAANVLLVDLGDPTLTAGTGDTPLTDQAGNPRIETARIDIGATEVFTPAPDDESNSNNGGSDGGGGSSSLNIYLLSLLATVVGLIRIMRKNKQT